MRFAEDIMAPRRARVEPKAKKKKKGAHARDTGEDVVKVRKGRRDYETVEEDEEYSIARAPGQPGGCRKGPAWPAGR